MSRSRRSASASWMASSLTPASTRASKVATSASEAPVEPALREARPTAAEPAPAGAGGAAEELLAADAASEAVATEETAG